jgi:hypothetical protein
VTGISAALAIAVWPGIARLCNAESQALRDYLSTLSQAPGTEAGRQAAKET